MSTAATLMTAEEYGRLPDAGQPTELVRGVVVTMNVPLPRHGQICGQVAWILRRFVEQHDLGHVLTNDSGVITARDPDTVRGADVAFYSFKKIPQGPLPNEYLQVTPDLVVEVLSPGDRWSRVLAKVAEYLDAGVATVCVLDSTTRSAHLYTADAPSRAFQEDEVLTLSGILEGFQVIVRQFFE